MADIQKLDEREIAFALVALKARCGQLGLFRTMHALEPATKVVGYELADIIEGRQHTAARDAAERATAWKGARP
jgi:hypothetical protein